MPLLTTINDLQPGMILSSNIVNKFNVLLPKGHELTDNDIIKLTHLIPKTNIYVIDPSLDDIVNFDDVSLAQTVASVVQEKSATVIDKIDTIIRSGRSLTSADANGMNRLIKETVAYVVENPVTMALVQQSKTWENYLQNHSSNVFYLSLLVGNRMRNYIKHERIRLSSARVISKVTELNPLGTAALFHDIAMVNLAYLYDKEEPLNDEEKELLRLHPHTGAQMLPESIGPVVRTSIRDHHENHIGTGYPEGI